MFRVVEVFIQVMELQEDLVVFLYLIRIPIFLQEVVWNHL
jgi:hypothetical protein